MALPTAHEASAAGTADAPEPRRPVGSRLGDVLDRLLAAAVTAFAVWTLVYQLAVAQVVGLLPAAVAALVVAVLPVRAAWRAGGLLPAGTRRQTWSAVLLGGAVAALVAVVVRPDLDDASYVTRSTWIAANGRIVDADLIFSDGRWPALYGQSPYTPSIEALVGVLSRVSGISVGSLVYVVVPPIAAAAVVWAAWCLLRAWRARRPVASLALTVAFLVLGGGVAASFGNYQLTRIWQGKSVFLGLVVPLLYACAAAFWAAQDRAGRRCGLVGLAVLGVVAAGLTTSATFVVPLVLVLAAVPGLRRRRWTDAVLLVVAGSAAPLAAAAASVLVRRAVALPFVTAGIPEQPWLKMVGTGVPAVVACVAGAAVVLGVVVRRSAASTDPDAQAAAAATVLFGVLILAPWVPQLVSGLLGTSAISWRLAWVVPLPVLVGLLASLPAPGRGGRAVAAAVPVAALVALVLGGMPLWDARNGAWVAGPRTWKVHAEDLRAADWVVRSDPRGRVLAPGRVVSAAQTLSADVLPVGARPDYMDILDGLPEAHAQARRALQRVAEGAPLEGDLAELPQNVRLLDVELACVVWPTPEVRAALAEAELVEEHVDGPYACSRRDL